MIIIKYLKNFLLLRYILIKSLNHKFINKPTETRSNVWVKLIFLQRNMKFVINIGLILVIKALVKNKSVFDKLLNLHLSMYNTYFYKNNFYLFKYLFFIFLQLFSNFPKILFINIILLANTFLPIL